MTLVIACGDMNAPTQFAPSPHIRGSIPDDQVPSMRLGEIPARKHLHQNVSDVFPGVGHREVLAAQDIISALPITVDPVSLRSHCEDGNLIARSEI